LLEQEEDNIIKPYMCITSEPPHKRRSRSSWIAKMEWILIVYIDINYSASAPDLQRYTNQFITLLRDIASLHMHLLD
jgi:hypothetical protein